jgi:pantoate--beta-alanine ligase
MEIYKAIEPLNDYLNLQKSKGNSVGFVPTMGALHQGHVSLILQSAKENPVVVVSIFVNPNQFNNPNDLKKYPRTPQQDIEICCAAGATAVFMPTVKEIYPEPDTRVFDFGLLDKVMEGKHRPGHFNGVAQVVSRLFYIVKPHRAYFGQKDFQQLAIIKRLVNDSRFDVEIVSCPTLRENDGLAMSSRNVLLTPNQRTSAPIIAKTLFEARNKVGLLSVKQMLDWVVNEINKSPLLKVEYFSIVNADTLKEVDNWNDAKSIIGCIAVYAGPVRLIDNIFLKLENQL